MQVDADSSPDAEVATTAPSFTLIEEGCEDAVLLGASVLHPLVEELIVETRQGSTVRAEAVARYFGANCKCLVTITLLSVSAPREAHYEMLLYGGGGGNNQER